MNSRSGEIHCLHDPDPAGKRFGAEVEVRLQSGGTRILEALDNPNAHILGARPFARPQYIDKLATLAEGLATPAEMDRFIALVERIDTLSPTEVQQLNIAVPEDLLEAGSGDRTGIL